MRNTLGSTMARLLCAAGLLGTALSGLPACTNNDTPNVPDTPFISDEYSSLVVYNRVQFLVMHYTAEDFERSLELLAFGDRVSVQYLLPATEEPGRSPVYRLVPEELASHQAGVSYFQQRTNLNDTSIGIENVNLGNRSGEFEPYPQYQIDNLIVLSQGIIERHDLGPTQIVGHSDIAPGRKIDPGPLFPWKELHDSGIGAWPDEAAVEAYLRDHDALPPIEDVQQKLWDYGYKIEVTGVEDEQTQQVVGAFQMHFRPSNYDGVIDLETVAILESLVTKYADSLRRDFSGG
jgi:N-acetylmuramoyl-L-alanine amidase